MALDKTGYAGANQGTTTVKIAIDENGYIAPAGTTPAGKKNFSINRVNAENSLQDNTDVLNFFLTLAQGVGDSTTNAMKVEWTVDS